MHKIYNMKYAFLYFFFLFFISVGYSQDIYDTIASESCSCIKAKKVDFTKNDDAKSMQANAGLCMINCYTAHKNEISESEQAQYSGSDGMRRLGEKIGIKMMNYCPETIIALGMKYLDENDAKTNKVIEEIKANPLTFAIEGKVTAIDIKEFVTIRVKDKNNRIFNFLILDYFDTASLFTENKIKVGDDLSVGYSEKELYDSISKDFKYFKVIISLEKI